MIHAIPSEVIARLGSAMGTQSSSGSAGTPGKNLGDQFMQLLTTQLENQSPLNPVDPSQFTSQLVQFNMLDQLAQINQTLATAFGSAGSTSTGSGGRATHSVQGAQNA